jgi:hypothetical protein
VEIGENAETERTKCSEEKKKKVEREGVKFHTAKESVYRGLVRVGWVGNPRSFSACTTSGDKGPHCEPEKNPRFFWCELLSVVVSCCQLLWLWLLWLL